LIAVVGLGADKISFLLEQVLLTLAVLYRIQTGTVAQASDHLKVLLPLTIHGGILG
jgi:hypothetical protein